MENIQTLLAAVAQTHGFDDDPVVASPPPVKVENSEPRPVRVPPIVDVSGNVQPSAAVDVPPIGAISAVGQVSAVGIKRKRGRPPKGQQTAAAVKPPSPKREKLEDEEEDVCFICFDGGSLVLCDRKGCPKAYHPSCIKRDEAFFQSKAKWNCGWHICTVCLKASHYMCYTCPFSLCKRCVKNTDYLCTKNTDYLCVRGTKGFCGTCLKMVMLIENKEQANNEQVKVDFDDKTSWEYLFKVYWVFLKEKLSLTLSEITRARPPLKVEPDDIDCKPKLNNSFPATAVNGNTSISLMKTEHLELSTSCVETSLLQIGRLRTAPSSVGSHVGGGPSHYHDITMPNMENVNNETGIKKDEQKLGGFAKWASKNVLEFVAFMRNGDTSPMSPSGVQTLLLEYIKRNNLRDPQQKSQILCDQRLKNLFGKPLVGHIEMLTLLEFHFPTKEDSENNSLAPADEKVNSLPSPPINSRKRKTRKGNEEIAPQKEIIVPHNHLHEYAAIDVHNVSLIYLRRNLVENLLEDPDFNIKVVGSIVRIRSSSQDPKQDIYRLVQVVGTMRVAKPYKVGKRTANSKLEVLNLDEKEVVSIDTISDQNFTEDECRWFRKSIRCGLLKPLTVGEVQKVAMALQPVRVNDWLETEMSRLNHLRVQASENGQKKEIKEYADRLELLKSSEERQRRIAEVPEIHTDPKMSPSYESEEDTKSGYTNKQVESVRPGHSFRQNRRKPISRNKRGKKDQPTPSQDRMVPKTEGIGSHGSGPVNQVNGTCGLGSVNQANCTHGLGSMNQSNGAHGLGSVNQANDTHGSSKPMNQVNASNSEIGGLEKTGLEDERAIQKPRLENEQAVQKPRLENEQAIKKPELENELAAQKPALVNEQTIEKPHLESERVIQMSRLENEQVIQKPGLENPATAQKTELKNEGTVQKPRLETSTTPASVENSSSANNDIETEKLWHYRDPNGKIQGPFSMMELRIWDTTGLFPPDIRIWTNHEQYDSLPLTEALIGHLHEGSESSCTHSSGSQENGTPGGIGESEAMNDGSEPMEAAPVNNVPENKSGLMKENPTDSSTWPQCWDLLNNKNSSTDDVQVNSSLPLSSCEKAEVVPLPAQCVKPEEREEVEKKNSEPTQDKTSSGNEHQNQCSNVGQPGEENSRPLKIDLSTNVVSLETESAVTAPVSNSLDLNKQIGNTENVDLATENGILELLSPAPRPNNDDTTDAGKQSGVLNFPAMDGAGPSWNDIGNEWCGYNSTSVKSSLAEWDSALVSAPVMKTEITSEYANAPISDGHQISQAATALPGPHSTSWLAMLNEAIVFDALGEDSISDLLAEVDARESQVAMHSPTSAIKFAREFLEDCKDDCFSSIEDFNPNLNQNQNLTSDPQKCDGSGSTGEMQLTGQSSCNPIETFDALDSLRKSSVHSSGSSEGETNAHFYSGDAGSEFHPSATNNPTGQEMVGHPNMTETGSGSDPVDQGWGSVQGNINLVTVQGNVNLVLGPNQGMTNIPWGTNPGTGWVNNVPSINQSPRNGSLPWDGQQRKYVGERYTSPRACYQGNEPGFTRGRPPRGRQPYSSGSSGGFSRGKGQRVCKFYESGRCKKGAFCDYLHP